MSELKSKRLRPALRAAAFVAILCQLFACANNPYAITPVVRESSSRQKPIYSRDWAPVLSQLSPEMSRKERVEAARKAGLQVTIDEKPWGDIVILYLDPATHATVLYEHIIVDHFPPQQSASQAPH